VVHQHLLVLPRIGDDMVERGIEHRTQLQVLADLALEHRHEIRHHLVEIDDARLQGLPAAEGE
jgi:hypothetical protein